MSTAVRSSDSYDVETDGRVVWVNDGTGLIGRFSRMGIDVHVEGQCQGYSCVKGPFTAGKGPAAWVSFKDKMLALHNIAISDDVMPSWCRND